MSWTDAPFCFVVRVGCPFCGSTDRIIVRTQSESDGSKSQKSVCKACSRRFIVIHEDPPLPKVGKADSDTA